MATCRLLGTPPEKLDLVLWGCASGSYNFPETTHDSDAHLVSFGTQCPQVIPNPQNMRSAKALEIFESNLLILQRRKCRHREVKPLVQNHTNNYYD